MRGITRVGVSLTLLIVTVAVLAFWWRAARSAVGVDPSAGRLLVLGIDGMDPKLLKELIEQGKMPNFARLAETGDFKALETSVPPQSPVAWSNVISGTNAGTHEIFDFIHRDPAPADPRLAILPYLSTSEVVTPEKERAISLGRWSIPLSGSTMQLRRQGPSFWNELAAHGVNTTVYRMPANYPPATVSGPGRCACLCGMGTPDLFGGYGSFTLFTPDAPLGGRHVSGGRLEYWPDDTDHVTGKLTGPANFLLKAEEGKAPPRMTIEFQVTRDAQADVAKLDIQQHLLLLKQGEWSDWVPLEFKTGIPGSAVLNALNSPTSIPFMVRFFLKQVHPKLQLYVSPLNIDPKNAVNPISDPEEFAGDLADASGRYYTAGIPQDNKALRAHSLTEEEFLVQCRIVLAERTTQYRQALKNFDDGCLFFYFGSVDQLSHIFWRDRDPEHPGRLPEQEGKFTHVIEDCYVQMDGLVGEALEVLREEDSILILSDHGFTAFRRGFNLNSWLVENNYMLLYESDKQADNDMFSDTNWSRTRAYGCGINGLYVNLLNRERYGTVKPGDDYDALLTEISEGLLQVRDDDGSQVIQTVYRVDKLYPDADPEIAPDLIVGYAAGYRASWATVLGGTPEELIEDNLDRWSGDHCIAHKAVPGIVVCNRKLPKNDPSLCDIAPTMLQLFGIDPPAQMQGRSLFAKR
jgi:predicted AlkP superfamily phosphohydrolase/phosphomutase